MKYKRMLALMLAVIIVASSVLPAFAAETYIQETESNDDHNVANTIENGKRYCGNLSDSQDVDWYKFEMPYTGNMRFFFDHQYIDSYYIYWKVSIYDSSLKQVNSYSIEGRHSFVDNKHYLEKGVYYIKVEKPFYSTDKQYNFIINIFDKYVERLWGESRYQTSYVISNKLKTELGVKKFRTIIVATGKDFADALSGSYLAAIKNAPILLTNGTADDISVLHECIKARTNQGEGATIYILGGEAAVPKAVENIKGYNIKRLSGATRYDTNIAILKEAGMEGTELIIATGKSFADSLSAAALKKPILLVKPGAELSDNQKEIVSKVDKGDIYIIGGEAAVSSEVENSLKNYGSVERVYGANRYETSVAVAERFFETPRYAIIANGKNFPDGLCGGSLAAKIEAPLILTADGKAAEAAAYLKTNGIKAGYVLGGAGALSDKTVMQVFQMKSSEEIIQK